MIKYRTYSDVRFTIEALEKAVSSATEKAEPSWKQFMIIRDTESWIFDTKDEFLSEYRQGFPDASFKVDFRKKWSEGFSPLATIHFMIKGSDTEVSYNTNERWKIDRFFNVLDDYESICQIPAPLQGFANPIVFVGHGRSTQWRDLKDHLHDQHGLDVETYETGARAGHTVRDVLEHMLQVSTFAILLLTAEDEMADGTLRPRENVVHEAGLFQGKLGFARAIVLTEEGVESFSNLQGVTQIRYSRGNIREVYGDVLATIKREFPTER